MRTEKCHVKHETLFYDAVKERKSPWPLALSCAQQGSGQPEPRLPLAMALRAQSFHIRIAISFEGCRRDRPPRSRHLGEARDG